MSTFARGGRRLAVCALAAGLVACASDGPPVDDAPKYMEDSLTEAATSQPLPEAPPPAVTAALLPGIEIDTGPASAPVEQRFEIMVKDSPAREFFMSLVEGTRYNMVVHPGVDGQVTLDLKRVTIPEVMEIARSVYGYDFRRTSYGYEVLPARLQAKVYQVNFLNIRRSGRSKTRVSSGQVSQVPDATAVQDQLVIGGPRPTSTSGTEINTELPETTFWTELETSIRAIVGEEPGRSVVVNAESGVVVVKAMPRELKEVEAYLSATHDIVHRQVILEAKVLEVELDEAYRQGINWAALFQVNGKSITLGQIGGGTIFEDGVSGINGNKGNLDPANPSPVNGTAVEAFGGMFTMALALGDFQAFIELLSTQGTVHVLSSPRIATLNNQKAVIKVGTDEFFVTDISSTTITGTATTTTPSIELTPFFSGIALDVTPQISGDQTVTLHVHPAISNVEDQEKTITINDIEQTLPLALSTVRESDSIIRARTGQVVVIGGLMENDTVDDVSKVPGLGDAPIVGDFFQHKAQRVRKSELVILLRPLVVEGGQQWADILRETEERVRAIHAQGDAPRKWPWEKE